MKNNEKKNEADLVAKTRAMSIAFHESILDASEEELRQVLQGEGRDLEEEAASAQDVIERAFQDAGVAVPTIPAEKHEHLGELLSVLRRKKKLTEAQLAAKARIPLEQIQRAESDPTFVPSLRTLAQLEDFFKLKDRTLSVLAGRVRVQKNAEQFREGVERFRWAAFSRGMEKLSREEMKLVKEIIRFLGDYTE